jgi:uncharacterized membrane protein YhiD involved in acid resistance
VSGLDALIPPGSAGFGMSALAVALAFLLSQIVSGVYILTFRGLSYSRSFVQSIPLGAIVTSMLMLAIGDSIAAGIGLAGGLSIIRFRTTMRDPRDMVFVFAGLGVGIACGLKAFPAALLGTGLFCLASVLLSLVAYGARRQFDGLLRLVAPSSPGTSDAISTALRRHAGEFVLVTLREASQGEELEHAYQVRIPDPSARAPLIEALASVEGVRDISLHMQDPTLEL